MVLCGHGSLCIQHTAGSLRQVRNSQIINGVSAGVERQVDILTSGSTVGVHIPQCLAGDGCGPLKSASAVEPA